MYEYMLVVFLAMGVVLVAALTVELRRRRPGLLSTVLFAAAVVAGVGWTLALLATVTGFRDADGFIDCWPSCSTLQRATGITLFWGGLVLIAVGLLATAALALSRRRPAP